jgi:ribosomal protein L37AE/L43A
MVAAIHKVSYCPHCNRKMYSIYRYGMVAWECTPCRYWTTEVFPKKEGGDVHDIE